MNALTKTQVRETAEQRRSAILFDLEGLICDLDRKSGIVETLFERSLEVGLTMLSDEHVEQLEHAISETREAARAVRATYNS